MIFIDDYSSFKYTKIQVPITLNRCPSDRDCSEYYIDIACESFSQQGGYVGEQWIDELHVQRIRKSYNATEMTEPKWQVEMIISGVKRKDESIQILEQFCEILSLHCAKQNLLLQYNGLNGFSFRTMDIVRSYAEENRIFGEKDFNYQCGLLGTRSLSAIRKNIFELPKTRYIKTQLFQELSHSFMNALRSTDPVARYILMYYLFEIMYREKKYHQTRLDIKRKRSRYRHIILYHYLIEEFHLNVYHSFEGDIELTPQILERIILTRDRLAHSADTSEIFEVMYHHMIPILRQVICSSDNEPINL